MEILHYALFLMSKHQDVVRRDLARWTKVWQTLGDPLVAGRIPQGLPARISHFVKRYPEFRSLLYYRVRRQKSPAIRVLCRLCSVLRPPTVNLYLATSTIGPGLFIQHGFSTIVAARSIGANCWINQQVTIGFTSAGESPTLGNNVSVFAGAKVLGNVTVGDNAVIGANAVVVKSVPANCTVVGIPARIVKLDGRKVNEPL